MRAHLDFARLRFRSDLNDEQQLGLRILGWLAVACLVGVTFTGVWQFFTHEPNPSWFRYDPANSLSPQSPDSEGMAAAHAFFGAASAVVALLGGAWYAYRVVFDIPRVVVLSLVVTVAGLITGSVIRFNAVKLRGRPIEEAGNGYGQLFANDVEFVITDRADLGATAIRLLTAFHMLTVPLLLWIVWRAIIRGNRDEA